VRVYKYPLEVVNAQIIMLPVGAEVLCVQVQHERPCIWACVEGSPATPLEARTFFTHGTGHPMNAAAGGYVGTYQLEEGALVFHVFESMIHQELPL